MFNIIGLFIEISIKCRKRKRSESDIVLSPIRPPNPAEAAAATLGNTMDTSAHEMSSVDGMDRSETEIDAILSRLIDIFPHQTPEYLKVIVLPCAQIAAMAPKTTLFSHMLNCRF